MPKDPGDPQKISCNFNLKPVSTFLLITHYIDIEYALVFSFYRIPLEALKVFTTEKEQARGMKLVIPDPWLMHCTILSSQYGSPNGEY